MGSRCRPDDGYTFSLVSLLGRRTFLGSIGTLAAGCSQAATQKPPPDPSPDWHDIGFPAKGSNDEQRALIFAPKGSAEWPVLVALHGRGEAGRGLYAGARGWRDDYHLDRAYRALQSGRVTSDDAAGMLSDERLAAINASLAQQPFAGLVIACPYTPVPAGRSTESAAPFASFLAEFLLPKVGELRGRMPRPASTGIDGVSMGGRYALQIGLGLGGAYRSIGALQPAIQVGEADAFADLAVGASDGNMLSLRLVSSEDDPFLEATRALASAFESRKLPSRLVVTRGPHDYAWNRGPGSIELLVHHERVLRGLPPP